MEITLLEINSIFIIIFIINETVDGARLGESEEETISVRCPQPNTTISRKEKKYKIVEDKSREIILQETIQR